MHPESDVAIVKYNVDFVCRITNRCTGSLRPRTSPTFDGRADTMHFELKIIRIHAKHLQIDDFDIAICSFESCSTVVPAARRANSKCIVLKNVFARNRVAGTSAPRHKICRYESTTFPRHCNTHQTHGKGQPQPSMEGIFRTRKSSTERTANNPGSSKIGPSPNFA